MPRIRFRRHAPPYMPGDVTVVDDEAARLLEAQGVIEIAREPAPNAARPAGRDETARQPKDKS